jgi:hypothetical protein
MIKIPLKTTFCTPLNDVYENLVIFRCRQEGIKHGRVYSMFKDQVICLADLLNSRFLPTPDDNGV